MPQLSLGLSLDDLGGSNSAIFGASPYVVNFTLTNSGVSSPNFSFDSIPNYTNYVDPNISYSLPLSTPAKAKLITPYVSSISTASIRAVSNRNFYFLNQYGNYEQVYFYFILQKNGSTYTKDFYKQVLDYTDYKGNNYYTFVLETTWTLSWNGTAWQLFGKANIGDTAGVIKTYVGGSASVLPYPSVYASDLDLSYETAFTTSLSDTNMNGTSNQLIFQAQASNNVFKTKTSSATLTQAGKLGLIFNFTLPSVFTSGSPSVSASFSNSYTALFSPLFTILSAPIVSAYPSPVTTDLYLPKDAVASTSVSLTTNGDLTNLTSPSLSLSQTSITIPNNVFSATANVISASLLENTTSSNRALSISGTKTYDNTSFTANPNVYQIGTTAPNPIISISSNNTTPRDFFLTHTGDTISTRTLGEPEGLALWDSTRKLWAIPKMGRYIRYFGGKYQFIEINQSNIIVTPVSNDSLSETNACSPSVMPWNATWIRNINVSKNYFDVMQKPTTLQINGTIYFPYSNYSYADYRIKSSQQQIGVNGLNIPTFKCGEYRKLVFKGVQGGQGYTSSGVNMVYSYAENKWFLTIYEYYDSKGSLYGNEYTYSAPYSTSFPITFTYVSRANTSSSTNITTLVVSKVTATAFDDVYTLADATYPVTIPVDTAFSSIW